MERIPTVLAKQAVMNLSEWTTVTGADRVKKIKCSAMTANVKKKLKWRFFPHSFENYLKINFYYSGHFWTIMSLKRLN